MQKVADAVLILLIFLFLILLSRKCLLALSKYTMRFIVYAVSRQVRVSIFKLNSSTTLQSKRLKLNECYISPLHVYFFMYVLYFFCGAVMSLVDSSPHLRVVIYARCCRKMQLGFCMSTYIVYLNTC